MMTRQHFEALANVISRIENAKERKELAEKTAKDCKRSNPRFNRKTFLKACGVTT
jgi:hypothetical protein